MKPTTRTYRALRIWTFIDLFTYIIFFISSILLSGVMMYVALTAADAPFWMRFFFAPLFALFWSFYVGLYPLVIYWNYYRFDKNTTLTINKKDSEVIYQNGTFVRKIKMENIIRLEQYYTCSIMIKVQYYKIIIENEPPIVVTSLLNSTLWKKFDNVCFKRIRKDHPWLLKRDNC